MESHAESRRPILCETIALLQTQIDPKQSRVYVLLAEEDPMMFIIEVISSAKAGHIDLPASIVRSLKDELVRIRMREIEASEEATDPRASAPRTTEPVTIGPGRIKPSRSHWLQPVQLSRWAETQPSA